MVDKKSKRRFNIAGIGPTKERSLIEAGYTSIQDLTKADFFSILSLPDFGYKSTYNLFLNLGRDIVYPSMIEVLDSQSTDVLIENKTIKPWKVFKKNADFRTQPSDFSIEKTTVWSFKDRGDWASHTPQYRGNWSPRVVRNVIELYTKPGDVVLDPMVGGGTTPVECYLTGRNSISVDINPGAINITRDRLNLPENIINGLPESKHRTYVGDVRNLNLITNDSIDLIATHPPYVNIIKYAPSVDGDLSQINEYELFFKEFGKAIKEFLRVLKPNGYCAILIGDTHNKSHYVPIANRMMIDFLREGFVLKEDIIKKEWNCESDRNLGKYSGSNFLLTMHEHLYIFKKPLERDARYLKNSSINFFNGH